MADRAAIVTGGSSGIGFAIARMLVVEGFGVTVSARRPDKLEAAAAELAQKGGEGQHVAGNMASEEAVQQVGAAHREKFGRPDALVNDAGVRIRATADQLQAQCLDMPLAVNVR